MSPGQAHTCFSSCSAIHFSTRTYCPWSYAKERQINPDPEADVTSMSFADALISQRPITKSRNGFLCVVLHVVPISLLPIHLYFIFLVKLGNAIPAVLFDPSELSPVFLWLFLEKSLGGFQCYWVGTLIRCATRPPIYTQEMCNTSTNIE